MGWERGDFLSPVGCNLSAAAFWLTFLIRIVWIRKKVFRSEKGGGAARH
jgi:hypothetical protein